MNQLLKLRYFQYKRDLGIWFCILLAAVGGMTWGFSENSGKDAIVISGIAWLILLQHFQNRKDLNFIRRYLDGGFLQVSFNYSLIALSVSIPLLINHHFAMAAILHLLVFFISLFRMNFASISPRFITKFIPASQFEWISGLRKYFLLFMILLPFTVLLSPIKLFGLIPLVLINVMIIDFYSVFEPRIMLNPENLSTEDFLFKKIAFVCKGIFLVNTPFLLINSFFYPDAAWFNLLFLGIFLCIAATGVCIKYSQYETEGQMRLSADYIILFAAFLVAYLLPVCILLFFYNYHKAKKNLSDYFT